MAEVISHWTGVPLSQLAREHNSKVLSFADDLGRRVRGQPQAIAALDRAMRATAAGLNLSDAPVGVFLLVGPSGVGKPKPPWRWLICCMAEGFLTTINMSEFQEKHSISRLIGSPPGYVGCLTPPRCLPKCSSRCATLKLGAALHAAVPGTQPRRCAQHLSRGHQRVSRLQIEPAIPAGCRP